VNNSNSNSNSNDNNNTNNNNKPVSATLIGPNTCTFFGRDSRYNVKI